MTVTNGDEVKSDGINGLRDCGGNVMLWSRGAGIPGNSAQGIDRGQHGISLSRDIFADKICLNVQIPLKMKIRLQKIANIFHTEEHTFLIFSI